MDFKENPPPTNRSQKLKSYYVHLEIFDQTNVTFAKKKGFFHLKKMSKFKMRMGKYLQKILLKYQGISLRNFTFDARFHRFLDHEAHLLGDIIRSFKGLKLLQLVFEHSHSCGSSLSDLGLYYLARGIKSLKKIKSTSIDIKRCIKITDLGLSTFLKNTHIVKTLESLDINLSECRSILQSSFPQCWASLLMHQHLKRLTISLSWCHIEDKGLSALINTVAKLNNLVCFELDLESCHKIFQDVVSEIFQPLTALKQLQAFSLNLKGIRHISTEKAMMLFNFLANFKELQTLKLNLTWSSITDEGLNEISKQILDFRQLRSLEINLRGNLCISQAAAQNFVTVIQALPLLGHRDIQFF